MPIYYFCDSFDYKHLYVYDITGGEITPVSAGGPLSLSLPEYFIYCEGDMNNDDYYSMEYGYLFGSFTDPAEMTLSEAVYPQIANALKKFHAGENGLPVTDDKYYIIENVNYEYNSLIVPMTAFRIDGDGSVSEDEVLLPEGTLLYAVRLDGKTYIDFRLEDGSDVRVYVTYDDGLQINGRGYYEVIL